MADTIPPGSRFGDYEILEELGAGGMGKVYRARDLTLDRLVALKTLARQLSADTDYVQRFLKEARAAARLNHPNIVQIYDFGCVDSVYYLAMEFVDGHSLGTYLKRGHFSESESIQIIRHACRALSVAHADGIVHRDIKPDNLMLTSRGDVKLVDLGIAKRLDEDQSLTQTGQAIGTPHYISPEQIRGQRDIDPRADIYSLGATLYHLLTGHTPYPGSSGPIVMSMHLVEPLPDPRRFEASLTEGVCRVVRKMMAKNRDERYPDVYALDLDLYRLQCGETPQADGRSAAAAEAHAGAPASPAWVPAKAAAFDSGVLNRIEDSLAAAVGPMAKVLVRKTARHAPTYEALCSELAGQVADPRARDTFLSNCLRAARTPTGPGGQGRMTPTHPSEAPTHARGAGPSSASGPSRHFSQEAYFGSGSASRSLVLSEQDLHFLETELARQIGPLARVVVKRAAKTTGVLADLISKLELEIPTDDNRRAFREAMKKHFH
ncbi:MAG TPA: serine/threonine-protein kinase [Thermoanaerobaculia bacterium]|nr:serine/threonine-protein kinase [Thermoanaerobaculia bacterium]